MSDHTYITNAQPIAVKISNWPIFFLSFFIASQVVMMAALVGGIDKAVNKIMECRP